MWKGLGRGANIASVSNSLNWEQGSWLGLSRGDVAHPYLERLVEETGGTDHLGVLREGEVVSLFNVQRRPDPFRGWPTNSGYCTSLGTAFITFLPDPELQTLLKRLPLKALTTATITRFSQLKDELKRVREQGYAVDNEEFEEGLKCIGAPVQDHSDKVIADISIAGPALRLARPQMPVMIRSVVKAAEELSLALGYRKERTAANPHFLAG